MAFIIGADVVVRPLANARGVIVEIGHHGRYRVRLESATIWCGAADLESPPERRNKSRHEQARQATSGRGGADELAPAARVDLHGLRVEEALALVLRTIDHALMQGSDRVEIVHGKGSGRIRDALHRLLATLPVVAAFRLDAANPGVTWVYF
ncbi:MAG: Smr/MutS family protein [Acidobacteriota bacterium]